MSNVRKPHRTRSRVKAADIASFHAVSKLRNSAVREVVATNGHIFVSERLHKAVITFLYTKCLTSTASELQIAQEFFRLYQHFAEGGTVQTAPFQILDRETTVRSIRKIINEDTDTSHEDHNDH